MKKLIFGLALLVTAACTNPSIERGFESLNAAVLELQAQFDALNIPQIIADLDALNLQVGEMIVDIEQYIIDQELAIAEFNAQVEALNARLAALLIQVQGVTEIVDGIEVQSGGLATTQQMQDLLSQVEEFGAGVDILVARADYDYDGVVNALDKCPDTPITEINDVDADGCSPSQLED
jgi:hypothetical protein